ncbi:hypothetical protein I4U23_029531 [Adineta vaga]|nr:hypothetical protein I4U23_029531 [Adineta vaga]
MTYSIVLKHLHTKSFLLLSKTNHSQQTIEHLHHAFSSFIQTFDHESSQLEQRAEFLTTIHSNIDKLHHQINASKFLRQKYKLHKNTYRIIRLHRHKKRQYLYQLLPQIQQHEKLTTTYKNHLDHMTSQTTNLLWKLFSYSPYKHDVNRIKTPFNSLLNNEPTITVSRKTIEKQNIHLSSSIELGSGDQLHSESTKERVDNNDDDIQWMNIVKQNIIQRQQTTEKVINHNNNNNMKQSLTRNKDIDESNDSLHLSDITYTTDYYSQNDSD